MKVSSTIPVIRRTTFPSKFQKSPLGSLKSMYFLKLRERDSWISLMSTPDYNPPDLSVKCQHKMAKTKLFLSKYAYLHVVRISTGILVNTRWPKPNLSFVKVFHSAFTLIHIPDLITIWQSIELFNIVIVVPISKEMFGKIYIFWKYV